MRPRNSPDDALDRASRVEALQPYEAIANISHDAIFVTDTESRIIFVNSHAAAMYSNGVVDDLLNQNLSEVLLSDDSEPAKSDDVDILDPIWRGESIDSFDMVRLGRDGQTVYGFLTASPIRDSADHIIGALVIVRDVTGQRTMADELERSEERYRALLEGSPDAIFVRSEDEKWEFRYVNSAGVRMFGAEDPQEMIGRSLLEFIHPEGQHGQREVVSAFQHLRDEGKALYLTQGVLARRDGSLVLFEASTIPTIFENESARLVFMRDITERTRLEQEMIRLERLDALRDMTFGISHNINNLLASILGSAQLLTRYTENPEAARLADRINQSTKRASELVRRLTQSLRGGENFVEEPVEVNAIVHQVLEELRQPDKDGNVIIPYKVEVVTDLQEDAPIITGSTLSLQEIMVDLLRNAFDAMPDGGKATVRTYSDGQEFHLVVSDKGIGMDEEARKRIFEPFFTTKAEVGAGLGLAHIYSYVVQLGGSIDVISEPGMGATFDLRFPLPLDN